MADVFTWMPVASVPRSKREPPIARDSKAARGGAGRVNRFGMAETSWMMNGSQEMNVGVMGCR